MKVTDSSKILVWIMYFISVYFWRWPKNIGTFFFFKLALCSPFWSENKLKQTQETQSLTHL